MEESRFKMVEFFGVILEIDFSKTDLRYGEYVSNTIVFEYPYIQFDANRFTQKKCYTILYSNRCINVYMDISMLLDLKVYANLNIELELENIIEDEIFRQEKKQKERLDAQRASDGIYRLKR